VVKKIQKKCFLDICTGPNTFFFGPKKFLKNFGAAFGTWYYLGKKRKKNLGSTSYQIRGLPVVIHKTIFVS
jgi:hypothetical protein